MPEPYAAIERTIDAVDGAMEVHAHMLVGPVAEIIANACEDADLLVTGSREDGPLERVLIGSIASYLVHTAPFPVLVVPRPA